MPKWNSILYETDEQLQWLQANYKDGDVIEIDDHYCDYCEEYHIGDNRCSCGNRRISAWVEEYNGGFYIITEPY